MTAPVTAGGATARGTRPGSLHAGAETLRDQVLEIIHEVLGHPDLGEETRAELVELMRRNEDEPERALLEHLRRHRSGA
ncbi:hypothetical protein [Sinomonas sp. G460-2]|uniref:hypothetical protein n=1 Tax=Sinomonas sp. G460-2 TaxID=3393464 RepID=UPI0039EE1052